MAGYRNTQCEGASPVISFSFYFMCKIMLFFDFDM